MVDVVEVLARAHALFAAPVAVPPATATGAGNATEVLQRPAAIAGIPPAYTERATADRASLAATAGVDDRMLQIVRSAAADHATAERSTRVILDAARADAQTGPSASPAEQQERMARQLARLRAQRAAVATARTRAQRRRALLALLRYRKQLRLGPGVSDGSRGAVAVRAALSKLGRPYVWGAVGPNAFDCSGLTQWAYRQAGVDLSRTTFTQINDGPAVPRSMIRPGDLVFPNAGHVQMYIGNGQVVEAPHAGANVQISALGGGQIRRPQ